MEKIAVRCENKEQHNIVFNFFKKNAIARDVYAERERANCMNTNNCVADNGDFCTESWYKERDYTIITYPEFEVKYLKKEESLPIIGDYITVIDKDFQNEIMVGIVITNTKEWEKAWLGGLAQFLSTYQANKYYQKSEWAFKIKDKRNWRKSTLEEKQWLDSCITANKFISKEESLKSSNEIPIQTTKEEDNTNLVEGEYYYFETIYGGKTYLMKKEKHDCMQDKFISNDNYSANGGFGRSVSNCKVFRKATSDEIKWLNTCIEANKFVPKPLPIMNTYGLKIGDKLDNKVINSYASIEGNFCHENQYGWKDTFSGYSGDRTIESFETINNIVAFKVSNCSENTHYLKAEGFKEFMENFDKPKRRVPQAGEYWTYKSSISNSIYLIEEISFNPNKARIKKVKDENGKKVNGKSQDYNGYDFPNIKEWNISTEGELKPLELKSKAIMIWSVKYCPEFTEDIFNHLSKWCEEQLKLHPEAYWRGIFGDKKYSALKDNKHFNYNNSPGYPYLCGIDNNKQQGEYISVEEMCSIIGYKSYPIIGETVKQGQDAGILAKELTSLPEKWFVNNPRNSDSQLLYDYATKVTGREYKIGTYFHFPDYTMGCCTSSNKENGYTEITFDQFKQWVLTPKTENKMKYPIGPISFKGKKNGDQLFKYSCDIPQLKHGNLVLGKNPNIKIIGYYDDLYEVSYIDRYDKEVVLGFKEDVLEPVSIPVSENLVGRWVKMLKDNPWGSQTKKGSYYKITKLKDSDYELENGYYLATKPEGNYEIMPEGFNPTNMKEEDWCIQNINGINSEVKEWCKGSWMDGNCVNSYYGVKREEKTCASVKWGKLLSTEEFYAKIGKVPSVPTKESMSKEDLLLEEVKKRYLPGTKYYVAHLSDGTEGNKKEYEDTVQAGDIWEWENANKSTIICRGRNTDGGWSPCVYVKEKWAIILSKPSSTNTSFKVGDIVCITDFGKANPSRSFFLNTPYKLSRDFTAKNGFVVEKDSNGNINNGWSEEFGFINLKLRHSTKEEIAKFNGTGVYQQIVEKYKVYEMGVDPYKPKTVKKGFDEKEHLSKPYNQLLKIQIKKVNKKQTKLQLL